MCCSPWDCKESDTTERLNKQKNKHGCLTQVLNQSMNSLGKNNICFSLRKGKDVMRDNPNYIASSTSKDICFHYQDKTGQLEGQSLEEDSTNSRSSGI